ncbi:hypothetical protein [Roseomonas fluvialis]|uniref:Uncharacterized protein n=1 Tax=Roseomonas fluvialis TaxID=1750527 RepID=A0ABN6P8X3_9PROT|nr:hypothetical protein [Roseomonas fluvialis]BDG74043.1 hypothetical protein Rmf_39720 [Roseomonas fluvialis]
MVWNPDADLRPPASDASITIETLTEHILGGWRLRNHAHEDLQRYHGKLLELMCQELGVAWRDDADALRAAWYGSDNGRREENEAGPMGTVHDIRSEAMSRNEADNVPLPSILRTICDSYAGIERPFDSFLEYRPGEREREILDAHIGGIDRATDALRKLWQRWLRDMLLLRWPDAASRTTSWERLAELGLGKPVDAADYF